MDARGWSNNETRCLISIWSNESVQRKLDDSYRNRPIYEEISKQMEKIGFSRTWLQCQRKIKHLKSAFRKAKGSNKSGKDGISCPFYEELDRVLGDRASYSPGDDDVLDSAETLNCTADADLNSATTDAVGDEQDAVNCIKITETRGSDGYKHDTAVPDASSSSSSSEECIQRKRSSTANRGKTKQKKTKFETTLEAFSKALSDNKDDRVLLQMQQSQHAHEKELFGMMMQSITSLTTSLTSAQNLPGRSASSPWHHPVPPAQSAPTSQQPVMPPVSQPFQPPPTHSNPHWSKIQMMLAVCVDTPGGPENLLLRTVPRPRPKDGEVLIKVHATAVNRADTLQRQGLYPPPPGESEIIGLEVAGTVAVVGPRVKGSWKPDDRVMALLSGGGYAEYVAVPEELLMPVPSHLTLCQAAAIPEAWLTAFQLLHLIAQVKEGEVVLVHAGASGVGTAAVQLARLAGAVPVATAGSPEKLKMAEDLGAAAGFNYKAEDFAEKIHDFTEGRGASVILDCVGGSFWEKNVRCLATDGRWVLYGTMGGKTVQGDLLGKLLSKRGQLLSSLLRSRSFQYKVDLVRAFSQRVLPFFLNQPSSLRPVIDSTFNLEDIADAHKHMEANRNMGKIVINVIPQSHEVQ
ncbi:quinone oxidoreductase PIG3 isoform 2-T2 [Polymixia lowei]